jgi:invasion protein IalB
MKEQSNYERMKTKNEIVDRLYKAGHISLEEVLVLCHEGQVVNIPYVQPYTPLSYPPSPWTITCSNDNPKIGEDSCLITQQLRNKE